MSIIYDQQKLEKIIHSFYVIMGIRVGIFDSNFKEIFSIPKNSEFCWVIQDTQYGIDKCVECGAKAFNIAKKRKEIYIHKCHAGLIEGAAPIVEDGEVIAYVVFGQVLDDSSRDKQWLNTKKLCSWHKDQEAIERTFNYLQQIDSDKLTASNDIISACTSYFLLKRVIKTSQQSDAQKLLSYIDNNYQQNLLLDNIAKDLSISKTKLCLIAQNELGTTVGKMLTEKRIEVAKNKLESTNLSITKISSLVGIDDYNYFGKKFKNFVGLSPTQYRKSQQSKSKR